MIKLGIIERNFLLSRNYADFFEALSEYTIAFQLASIRDLNAEKSLAEPVDVVILDVPQSETFTREDIAFVRRQLPTTRFIIFTARTDIMFIMDALKNGIDGFLLKTQGLFELHEAIKIILRNGLVISPAVARLLIPHIFSGKLSEIPMHFTSKEKEIISLVQEGLSYKEMADELKVTPFTINHHLKKIYKKGGVNSRSQLMVLLQKHSTI